MTTRARQIMVGVGGIVLLSLIVFALLYRRTTTATVVGKTWYHGWDIEQLRTVREDDWDVPAGGRLVRTWVAVHHWIQVPDGSRMVCQNDRNLKTTNCHSETTYRSQAVYATRYEYDIDRWFLLRRLEWRGRFPTAEPTWLPVGHLDIPPGHDPARVNDLRAGQQHTQYILELAFDDRMTATEVDAATWQAAKVEGHVTISLSLINTITGVIP